MTNPSAYGLPLIGTDRESSQFLAMRRERDHMTGLALRLRRLREHARRMA